MELSENAKSLLAFAGLIVEEHVAQGDKRPIARRKVALECKKHAGKLAVAIRHADGSQEYLAGAGRKYSGSCPTDGPVTIDGNLLAAHIDDWLAISGILRLRNAIAELGQDATSDELIQHAHISRNRGLPLLRWLECHEKYRGITRQTRKRYTE